MKSKCKNLLWKKKKKSKSLPRKRFDPKRKSELSKQDKGFELSSLYFETRVGYEAALPGMDFNADASGFRGSYLNMRLDAGISSRGDHAFYLNIREAF